MKQQSVLKYQSTIFSTQDLLASEPQRSSILVYKIHSFLYRLNLGSKLFCIEIATALATELPKNAHLEVNIFIRFLFVLLVLFYRDNTIQYNTLYIYLFQFKQLTDTKSFPAVSIANRGGKEKRH